MIVAQGDPAAVGTGQPNHRAGGIGLSLRGQRLTEMFAVIGMDPLRTPPVDQWAGLIDPLQGRQLSRSMISRYLPGCPGGRGSAGSAGLIPARSADLDFEIHYPRDHMVGAIVIDRFGGAAGGEADPAVVAPAYR